MKKGKITQRAIVALLYLSLLVAALPILLVPAPVKAGMLRCALHHLPSDEQNAALVHAQHAVPVDGRKLTLKSACWNLDFAKAWLRTPTVIDVDGVRWWWAVRCDRSTRAWSCDDVTRERRIEVPITDVGRSVTVVSSFPDGMLSTQARAIIMATAPLAMKAEMPLPACSPSDHDADQWRQSRFSPGEQDLESPTVQIENAPSLMVDYGWSLRINVDSNNQPSCWGQIIVVT